MHNYYVRSIYTKRACSDCLVTNERGLAFCERWLARDHRPARRYYTNRAPLFQAHTMNFRNNAYMGLHPVIVGRRRMMAEKAPRAQRARTRLDYPIY